MDKRFNHVATPCTQRPVATRIATVDPCRELVKARRCIRQWYSRTRRVVAFRSVGCIAAAADTCAVGGSNCDGALQSAPPRWTRQSYGGSQPSRRAYLRGPPARYCTRAYEPVSAPPAPASFSGDAGGKSHRSPRYQVRDQRGTRQPAESQRSTFPGPLSSTRRRAEQCLEWRGGSRHLLDSRRVPRRRTGATARKFA